MLVVESVALPGTGTPFFELLPDPILKIDANEGLLGDFGGNAIGIWKDEGGGGAGEGFEYGVVLLDRGSTSPGPELLFGLRFCITLRGASGCCRCC